MRSLCSQVLESMVVTWELSYTFCMELSGLKYLVVGGGLFGSVVAERIAESLGERVLLLDRKACVGGSAYSSPDAETGIEVHRYGTHVFHTDDSVVWEYMTHFGRFNHYRHQVWTRHAGRTYSLPVSLATLNAFFGKTLTPAEAVLFLAEQAARENIGEPVNLEEMALSRMGRALYEAFVRNYTLKQWGRDPRELPVSILSHFALRTNYHSDYFDSRWQGVPVDGYGSLFRSLLRHSRIDVLTGVNFLELREQVPADCRIIYTGAVDELFGCELGALAWRGLRFEQETLPIKDYQGAAVMNSSDLAEPYTRVHEFKHMQVDRPELMRMESTVVAREYSLAVAQGDEKFYPVADARNAELYRRYLLLVQERWPNMVVGGRLGSYAYWNMSETIRYALECFRGSIARCASRHTVCV